MKRGVERALVAVLFITVISAACICANLKMIDVSAENSFKRMLESNEDDEFKGAWSASDKQTNAKGMTRVLDENYMAEDGSYPEWYGGCYIADNDVNLVIRIVKGHEYARVKIMMETSRRELRDIIVFEEAEWSFSEQEKLYGEFRERWKTEGSDAVAGAGISSSGRIIVTLIESEKGSDNEFVQWIESDPRFTVEYASGYPTAAQWG